MKKFLITGGAGFIGSAVVRHLISHTEHSVLNFDKLTYAGNLDSVIGASKSDRYQFVRGDICDKASIDQVLETFKPDVVMHLAAESHVDRSIDGPAAFIETNIKGTFTLLESCLDHWRSLDSDRQGTFRFHHVSTDEVYGDLGMKGQPFTETNPYDPSSPYSASKAGSDHLVRAWGRTYGMPFLVTNCSNNYGPYHFPEKLIPHMILNALAGKTLPVYGNGQQVRDWLYVEDHAEALVLVANTGVVGETYNIGGGNEIKNLEVVHMICELLEKLGVPKPKGIDKFESLIAFVPDRPGHDTRYAINASKIRDNLGWVPRESFETGLAKTVEWFVSNSDWWEKILAGDYLLGRVGIKDSGSSER